MESGHAAVPLHAAKVDSSCSAVHSKIAEVVNNHSASTVPSQVAVTESNQGGFSGGGVERVLEQLVSRMDRLEQICLGFQEKMVMPMNSIETRLQRVEQQLDTLTQKLQSSASPSCYRISAPDASSTESDDISCDIGLDDPAIREIESDNNYLHTEVSYVSPHDMSDLEYAPQIFPGLVVTAPEFSDDEDEVDNASGPEMNSPNDRGKQSIDDALSSALANFLSSSLSLESPKNTDTLPYEAPEVLNEDDDNHESDEVIAKNDKYGKSDVLSSDVNYISNELLDNQTPSGLNITHEGSAAWTELTSASATEVPEKTFHENIIENVLEFSLASNVVDFEIPLLDVKFISQRSPVTEGFLEALLVETPETSSRDPSLKESNDDLQLKGNGSHSVEEQCNLISVNNGELENPASDDHFALDEAFCTSIASSPVNMGVVDNLQGDHKRKRDVGEISPSSLI